ncbi:MAG TPA: hypothetical protein VK698_15595 [Kofleriaceae bacterium]|nr:hypothetical protein [Kofleriaceae bacterium]
MTPRAVHEEIRALRTRGHASVQTTAGRRIDLPADRIVSATFPATLAARLPAAGLAGPGQEQVTARLTIAELIANCPDVPPFAEDPYRRDPPCLLQATQTPAWIVERERVVDWGTVGDWTVGTASLTAAVGLGVCALACDEPWDRVAGLSLVGGLLVVTVVGAYYFARSL